MSALRTGVTKWNLDFADTVLIGYWITGILPAEPHPRAKRGAINNL